MTPENEEQDGDRLTSDDPSTVGGVLLAAGESTRFESGNKLTATVDDTPIVRRSAESLVESRLDEVVAVVGHEEAAIRDELSSLDVSFLANQHYQEGQSTSVRAGVEAAQTRAWDATLIALGDMPFVNAETIDALVSAYLSGRGTIVVAAYEGKRGNPVLFDAEHYEPLTDVTGDKGGRRLIEGHEDSVLVETDDPGTVRDVDYEADIEEYTE